MLPKAKIPIFRQSPPYGVGVGHAVVVSQRGWCVSRLVLVRGEYQRARTLVCRMSLGVRCRAFGPNPTPKIEVRSCSERACATARTQNVTHAADQMSSWARRTRCACRGGEAGFAQTSATTLACLSCGMPVATRSAGFGKKDDILV